MEIELRTATLDDLATVYGLETQGFDLGIQEEYKVFEQRIRTFPQGFLIASFQGCDIGYFCCEIWESDQLARSDVTCFELGHDITHFLSMTGHCLYIASMTITSSVRGLGLGKKLFEKAINLMQKRFPQLETAMLIVNEHWISAQKIYLSCGFKEVGRIDHFFHPIQGPDGCAFVMFKELLN